MCNFKFSWYQYQISSYLIQFPISFITANLAGMNIGLKPEYSGEIRSETRIMMAWYSTMVYLISVNKKTLESLSYTDVYMSVTDPYAFMNTILTSPLHIFKYSG